MSDRPPSKPPYISAPKTIDSPAYTDCNGRVWTWGRWFVLNFYQQILVTRGLNPYTALELTGDEETSHRQEDNIRETPGSTGSNESTESSNAERAGMPDDMNQPSTSGVATQTVSRIDVPRTAGTPSPASQPDSEAGTSVGPSTSSALSSTKKMVDQVESLRESAASQGPIIDENPEQEADEEETPMEGIETPLREVLVVLHVNDSELVLGTATEITTDAPPVPVAVTTEASEDIPDDSSEPERSSGGSIPSFGGVNKESKQPSTSTAPIVEDRTIELESEHLIRTDNQLGMEIVEQTTEGVNVTNNDSYMEIGGKAPVDRETKHGDDIAVAASSQVPGTTDTARAPTPEEELMEVTNEDGRRGEKEKHEMNDELIRNAEEIIRQMNETRRPEEQCERMGNSIRIPRPAARDEPSTSSGLVYDYVPIQSISLYSDNHQHARSNPIRNLIQLIKTSAQNEAITSSRNYEESQDVQRAIEESLRSAQYRNKDSGDENSNEAEPCTSSAQQQAEVAQEVQMEDSNSSSDADQIEITSQVTNGRDQNEASTSYIYSESSHGVQANTSESVRHVDQDSTEHITMSPTQEEPSSSSTSYEDNEEVQENVDESSRQADQFGNMEKVEPAGDSPITSTNYFDDHQELLETDSKISRHEQAECMEASEYDLCDSRSSSSHYDDDQVIQENEIESSTLANPVGSTTRVTMSPNRNEPCTTSAFFEDYEEIYGSDDEISSYTYQLENTRHVTEGLRHDEPCTSSAYYDNYHEVQEDDDESSNDVDQLENTGQASRRPSQNDPCTSSAYYNNDQEDQSNESESSTSVDQLVSTTQFNGTSAQIEPGTLSDDYEEYEEVQESVGMSSRQADQFGRIEPTTSSAPYEVLQEVRENIEGSLSYVDQFDRLESHTNRLSYDEPSTTSAYYDEYPEVQHFGNTRRSARLPTQYVSSTSSAYYNNYREVQSNDIGSSGLVDQFEQVEMPKRRPAHNYPTTLPVQYYGYQEVQRSVVDSSREVDSFDNRRRSTRRRTPNVRSISPAYNNNYQQEQRNNSSRRVDQKPRNKPAQNELSTSSAWSKENGVFDQEVSRSFPERSRARRFCEDMERALDRTLPDNPSALPVISGVYDPNESVRDYLKRMRTLQQSRTPSVRQQNHGHSDVHSGTRRTRQHGARNSTRNLVQEIDQQYSQITNQSQSLTRHDDYDNKADNQTVESRAQDAQKESPKPTKKYERFVVQKRKEHHLTRAKAAELGLSLEGPIKKKPTPSRKRERNDSETSDWTPDKKKKKSGKKNNRKGKK